MDDSMEEEVEFLEEKPSISHLPPHSKEKYMAEYNRFCDWVKDKNKDVPITENLVFAYFAELSTTLKPPSLWSRYSILKSTIQLHDNVDISEFKKLRAFLKKRAEGYIPKRAKTLTEDDVERFLKSASDEEYLVMKVALIFGFLGALRIDELVNVRTDHVEEHGGIFLVKIPTRKTKPTKSFAIYSEYYDIVKKYIDLRPTKCTINRFFLNYKNRKCTVQPIGRNKLAAMPRYIATFLNLEDPNQYTGHTFRRSSTMASPNAGADILRRRKYSEWKSTNIAECYIEESITYKKRTGNLITSSISLPSKSSPSTSTAQSSPSASPTPSFASPSSPSGSNEEYNENEVSTIPNFLDIEHEEGSQETTQYFVKGVPYNDSEMNLNMQPIEIGLNHTVTGSSAPITFNNCSSITINIYKK